MPSVFCLKDGRWAIDFPRKTIIDDPNRTRLYFGRGIEAEQRAISKFKELGLDKPKHTGPIFGDIADAYISSRSSSMAKSTVDNNFYALKKHILPFFGNMRVNQITPEVMDQYVKERKKPFLKRTELKDGSIKEEIIKIKNVTIHRQLSIVKSAMSWAYKRNLIAHNPVAGYELPKRDDAIIPPPTPEELGEILKHAAEHLKRAIILSFNTALRPGCQELLQLRWECVNFVGRTIFIESAKKNGLESRTVPLNNYLYDEMKKWHESDKKKEYIIHHNGKPVSSLKTAWRTAKTKAKILRRIRLYDIRHSAITHMLEAGADLKSVSMIAGHADPSMTMKVYQHASAALKKQAINTLPNFGSSDSQNSKSESSQT